MSQTESTIKSIGEYKVIRLIGKGGMSEVYEVENIRLGSRHALKLFTCDKSEDEVLRRFEVEGRLLAKLNHPRIVRVTDFGTDDETKRAYFVMDLVRDSRGMTKSLSDVPAGSVDEETIARWYDDLRDALAYIHSCGVIHRDLKLQNVLIGPDGHVVLTDFGISKIFQPASGAAAIVDTVQTIIKIKEGRGLVMGSIGYMAPEIEMGVAASVQSDWYALGVIVYRLLTGMWCDSRTDILSVLDGYDPAWSRIIPKLLHSNPSARECLSYSEEHRRDVEKAEYIAEERYLNEKTRGRRARHLFRYMTAAVVLLASAVCWVYFTSTRDIAELNAKLAIPTFETVFEIPEESGDEEMEGMPSIEQFRSAMVDALVLTQGIFADLREETISSEKARAEISQLWRRAKADDMDLFSGLPDSYSSSGETVALTILLKNAVKKLK